MPRTFSPRTRLRSACFLALILVIQPPAFAAEEPIRRFSLSLKGEGSLSGYSVSIQGTDLFFTSDESGNLALVASQEADFPLAHGTWQVEIIRGNARSAIELKVDAATGKSIVLDLSSMKRGREKGAKKMEGLSVSGSEARKDQGRQVITASEMRTMPGAGGDLLRGVENFPGIVKGAQNDSGMYVRGSGRDDMAYRLGLMRIGDPFHPVLLSQYSVFPGSILDRVEFYPGGYPPSLGGVQGGVLQAFPKSTWEDRRVHGEVDVNLAMANASLTVPIGPVRLTASARRTYFEAYMGLLRVIPGLPSYLQYAFSQTPSVGDYFLEAAWQAGSGDRISVKAIGSLDQYEIKTDQLPVTDENGQTNLMGFGNANKMLWEAQGLDWHHEKNAFTFDLVASHLRSTLDVTQYGSIYFSVTNDNWQATARAVWAIGRKMKIELGAEWVFERQWGSLREPETGSETNLNPNLYASDYAFQLAMASFFTNAPVRPVTPSRHVLSPWIQWEADLGPVNFSLGSRFTWNPALAALDWEPRFELGVPLGKDWSFFSRFGRYSQYPPFLTWDSFGLIHQQQASTNLPYTLQASGGVEGKVAGLQVKVEGYYKRFVDQPLANPVFDPLYRTNALEDPTSVLAGTGRAAGVEVLLRRSMGKYFTGWLTYAFASSTREVFPVTNNGYVLTDASNNGMDWKKVAMVSEPVPQDVAHVLRALVSWKPSARFQVGARVSVKSGAPYTRKLVQWVDGSTTNSAPNGAVNAGELRYVDDDVRFTERYPVAVYVDLRFDWTIPVGKRGQEFRIYLDLWNLQALFGGNQTSYAYDQRVLRDLTLADWSALKTTGDKVAVPRKALIGMDPTALPIPLLGVSYSF